MRFIKSLLATIVKLSFLCFVVVIIEVIVSEGQSFFTDCTSGDEEVVYVPTTEDFSDFEDSSTVAQVSAADRLPSIPEELHDNVFLQHREGGICQTLTGDVLITVIFVDTPTESWTSEEMEVVAAAHQEMTSLIMTDATAWNVDLNLTFDYRQSKVDLEFQREDRAAWLDATLAGAGLSPALTAGLDLETDFNVKEAPILFCLPESGRSFASSYPGTTSATEYAIFYTEDSYAGTYQHELYHLFGAKDFYYPAEVLSLAESYFPSSTMMTTVDAITDNLTAYLIGWTDSIPEDALAFLQETNHITAEDMQAARSEETYTGYVENYEEIGSIYTGDLVYGLPHGYGKRVMDSGNSYEGNWDNGTYHGQGVFTWSDGSVYEGTWVQGVRTGYGVMTWSSGEVYEGEFVDGKRHGQGTYTWPDGTVYTGAWDQNLRTGYGILTWSNGAVYEGDFVDGTLFGYGTYTYADGSVLSGYWEDGSFVE